MFAGVRRAVVADLLTYNECARAGQVDKRIIVARRSARRPSITQSVVLAEANPVDLEIRICIP